MATKEFTSKQKEIVARKMGYDGPMSMFDVFLNASPVESRKYEMVKDKFMNRGGAVMRAKDGGAVKKFAVGGTTIGTDPDAPQKPTAQSYTAAQIQETPGQIIDTQLAPEQAKTIAPVTTPTPTATATAAPTTQAATVSAVTAAPSVAEVTEALKPATGTISTQSQVQPAQVVPTQTAVAGLEAAQGTATQISEAPVRTIQAGELVSGPAVDRATVEAELEKAEAAQGVVKEEATLQGQLNKLVTDFQTNNPPPWAAASMRNVTAQLAQRGLGASSLAGQALIQATLEAAVPIASADAQTYQQMELQNLSNRQQVAILTAQQRAQFLGQEFDQGFQTKVLNAAKIADVANVNFSAQQQIVLENARLAQTMDLANLNNQQALVMASAAQIASLETQNLNNRQQASVMNAQAFLQMDMTNLANTQQVEMFRAQSNIQSLLSDQAAQNAAKQFNASSENQINQFFANMATQISQFNATQTNAMSQFDVSRADAITRFNAESQNQREQFNAQNRLVIDQANAQWRRDIATANTAAINRSNEFNATKAMELTTIEYNNMWQRYRDNIEYAWKTADNDAERAVKIATQEISANATIMAKTIEADAKIAAEIGKATVELLKNYDVSSGLGKAWDWVSNTGVGKSITDWAGNIFD